MFEKFGEFDSAEEINAKAAALKAEYDGAGLKDLAEENGLDPEDAEDFADGIIEEFCTPYQAALGKLKMEKEAMKLTRELADLAEEVEMNLGIGTVAAGVRKKGKSLAEYLAKIVDEGYKNAIGLPKEITDRLTALPKQYRNQVKTGIPNKAERMRILKEYYGG